VKIINDYLPGQTGNVQFLHTGLSPIRTLAKEDFPTPVAPRMTMRGNGRSFYGRKKKN
jgi:hypothetical protein